VWSTKLTVRQEQTNGAHFLKRRFVSLSNAFSLADDDEHEDDAGVCEEAFVASPAAVTGALRNSSIAISVSSICDSNGARCRSLFFFGDS
jgi:hypothetical protein